MARMWFSFKTIGMAGIKYLCNRTTTYICRPTNIGDRQPHILLLTIELANSIKMSLAPKWNLVMHASL